MPHTIRWILANSDQRVAAFAMPGTCEPEGYIAEKRKGNVRSLPGGARTVFSTRLGYVDAAHAAAGKGSGRTGDTQRNSENVETFHDENLRLRSNDRA